MNNKLNLVVVVDLSEEQRNDVSVLQKLSFTDVSEEEASEDFYNPEIANVLAYVGKKLVGWTGIHRSDIVFEDKPIKLGGYGICTHPDFQGRGIASLMSAEAMKYLKNSGVDVAFLSVDLNNIPSIKVHKKNGFVEFPRMFSWINSKGETKQDDGGMIAPVNSQELFEYILYGGDNLFVGNGYW